MKKISYSIYTLLFVLASSVAAVASPVRETSAMSNAMFLFLGVAAIALGITYLLWKINAGRRKGAVPKVVNRGPVRRPIIAYQKRRAA